MDSQLTYAVRDGRVWERRLVDREWRTDRPPLLDIQVPQYELPLPEGIGDEKIQVENKSLREIENTWRERLHEAQARNPNR
ncbi:hypothetical protein EMCRGX_G020324 [Ephydatia muelleri]|eukprot:Em0016g244a